MRLHMDKLRHRCPSIVIQQARLYFRFTPSNTPTDRLYALTLQTTFVGLQQLA